MRFSLVVILLTALFLLGKVPASVFDVAVDRTLHGDVRLAETAGTVWNGNGLITVRDSATRDWHPWVRVEWQFDRMELLRGRLGWSLNMNGGERAHVSAGMTSVQGERLLVRGPAAYFWQRIPGPLAKFAWGGDVSVAIRNFDCTWAGQCRGRADVRWSNAASDFLPGQVFGTYVLHGDGVDGRYTFVLNSEETSPVKVAATGSITQGNLQLAGTIRGDAVLLKRLPAVANAWVRPTPAGDTWEIHFP